MQRSKYCIKFLLVMFVTAVAAQDTRPAPVAMNGVGLHSCGIFLEDRRTNNEIMVLLYQQWAAGYMAGYSGTLAKPGTIVNISVDLKTYTAWLEKWCSDDPLSTVFVGLAALRNRLQSKP